MHITETVESQCVIESDKKLTFTEVSNSEIWCEDASKDGQPDDNAIL